MKRIIKPIIACFLLGAAPAFAQTMAPTPKTVDLLYQQILKAEQQGEPVPLIRSTLQKPEVISEVQGAVAQYKLGLSYLQSRDYTQAAYWFRKAADQGYADAEDNLGVLYDNGQRVPQDYTQAAYWCRKAADQGNAGAEDNLGIDYANGQGVSQDYTQAAYWFRKAANQGLAYAQYNLGFLYAKGQGVPQDYTQAAYWCRKAAN